METSEWNELVHTNAISQSQTREATPGTSDWLEYFDKYPSKLFSKGTFRQETWRRIAYPPHALIFQGVRVVSDKEAVHIIRRLVPPMRSAFILSALIIIFQVFGDANHRTADKFYYMRTGKHITPQQMKQIDAIGRQMDYGVISHNPLQTLPIVIDRIQSVIQHGGRRRTKKTRLKHKSRNR